MARMSSPHLKCCINVGFREAPCKKSFGILASYWTPPKIKLIPVCTWGGGGAGSENLI